MKRFYGASHFYRTRQLSGVETRKDYYYVDPREIVVKEGWNPRTDFSGENDLVNSIIENGVQVPLRVRRGTGDRIHLIDGERRLRASLRAISLGHEIQVPCIFERNGISGIEALFLSLLTNQGKPLDPIEVAAAFGRFISWGLSTVDISRKIGKSTEFVRQRLVLVDAAPKGKEAVRSGEVSLKDAVTIVRKSNGSPEQQTNTLNASPRKGERRPRQSPLDKIIHLAEKLSPAELTELIGKLERMGRQVTADIQECHE